jgi:hypothetical protein
VAYDTFFLSFLANTGQWAHASRMSDQHGYSTQHTRVVLENFIGDQTYIRNSDSKRSFLSFLSRKEDFSLARMFDYLFYLIFNKIIYFIII